LRTDGTRRLLSACTKNGVGRYIQQSITLAYADGGDKVLDESTPFDPTPSRATIVDPIREMEHQVRASSLYWTILRGGEFVGPGTMQDGLVASLKAGDGVNLRCNGQYWMSPIHPADMASAIVAALTHAPRGSTFNITAEPLRYVDYVDQLATLTRAPQPPRHPPDERPCPPSHRCTARSAQESLAWRPRHSFWPKPVDILPRHLPRDTPT
jgi:nucleoside-diphosphate-sugar epimerase